VAPPVVRAIPGARVRVIPFVPSTSRWRSLSLEQRLAWVLRRPGDLEALLLKAPLCAVGLSEHRAGGPRGQRDSDRCLVCVVVGRGATVGEQMIRDARLTLIQRHRPHEDGEAHRRDRRRPPGPHDPRAGGNNALIISEEGRF